MDEESSSSPTQRAKFNIDLEVLGAFLADSFIKRVDAFMPADRITILKACRVRLAAEGGDILEHLLTEPQPRSVAAVVAPQILAEQLAAGQPAAD